MTALTLIRVDTVRAAAMWPHVAPMLAKAFDKGRGDDTIEILRDDVLFGRSVLWIAWDEKSGRLISAAATKIMIYPRCKILHIQACGGIELHRWKGLLPDLEVYGAAEGCAKVRISGRRGWRKICPDYREPFVTIEKDLA